MSTLISALIVHLLQWQTGHIVSKLTATPILNETVAAGERIPPPAMTEEGDWELEQVYPKYRCNMFDKVNLFKIKSTDTAD